MFKPCVEFFVLHAGLFIQVYVQVYECLQGFIGGFQPFSRGKEKARIQRFIVKIRAYDGAGYESRTRHLLLGKQSLYRMS